ncbi:hypothetical protein FHG66_10570 [Rubellimicrobium rubrum]|uniref:DUF6894 domain-containing protein n=1 Tax=Rubellimicrobium rubrum TaxID=2585369 RepID=A0A5C4MU13_9RHOB|nr:hypothetical protein [Rubellimicrobium rubrum]TNC49556.1 hypothetical protein FHG66_10570 [Rubellimicrobium rubrum]
MPRYFFDVQDGRDLPDEQGTVYADPETARLVAVSTSGEMIAAHAKSFWAHRDWRMHVTDEQGAAVCDLQFTGTAGAA